MLSSGFMDWMKRASFILRLKLYLQLAKTSGLAVLALCPGLSNCRYVCSRCLSMLGHSGINIASGFSNIHLSTRACDFVYHICSHVQRYFFFYVEEFPNSTTFIQNYNFKFFRYICALLTITARIALVIFFNKHNIYFNMIYCKT